MTTLQAAKLVAGREVRVKLRDKAFLFSTVLLLFFTALGIVLPMLLEGGPTKVAVTGATHVAALEQAGLEVQTVPDLATAERLVREEEVEAAVVDGPRVLALEEAPDDVVSALSTSPPVEFLEPDAVNEAARFLVPFVLSVLFFFTTLTFGVQIAQSVTEEKQTRIVEILVSSVPVRALLIGKVAAMTLLAFGQLALLAVVGLIGMRVADVGGPVIDALLPTVGWFLPFFMIGFLMLATLWAGVGALAARLEDVNGTSAPLQMLVMTPFFLVLSLQGNATAMTVLSYIPFSAPIAMPVRIFSGEAAAWEPYLALAVLLAATAATILAGARIYQGSLLRTNGRTSYATAWRNSTPVV
ncbi:ABC transporter permease [Actinoplanes sp. NEAU-A12]|uniref:ABC transporter permease n=1 Tax=Actinoplanes sandaracinus TaxID=3045177 RepID=A0ABT6WD13_9ACTN|nr:ABC transporter permease [Actinoplanes sandaracinus]MDI6097593.1 ABC transporter permease [Actinoplanes sandaracinus]